MKKPRRYVPFPVTDEITEHQQTRLRAVIKKHGLPNAHDLLIDFIRHYLQIYVFAEFAERAAPQPAQVRGDLGDVAKAAERLWQKLDSLAGGALPNAAHYADELFKLHVDVVTAAKGIQPGRSGPRKQHALAYVFYHVYIKIKMLLPKATIAHCRTVAQELLAVVRVPVPADVEQQRGLVATYREEV